MAASPGVTILFFSPPSGSPPSDGGREMSNASGGTPCGHVLGTLSLPVFFQLSSSSESSPVSDTCITSSDFWEVPASAIAAAPTVGVKWTRAWHGESRGPDTWQDDRRFTAIERRVRRT